MSRNKYLLLVACYLLIILSLFIYSFTQVDLNLTLSDSSTIQNLQKFFIQIGYFNRPLSTAIFLVLILLLVACYLLLFWLTIKKKLTEKQIWLLIILMAAILLFSYSAFSHDIFNYIFWARIFTHYGLSPYQFKALDFPNDSWTRFMHWTHVTYNHGPVFLGLSFIPSFLGLGKFTLTLINFKLLMAAGFVGSVFLIGRIMEKVNPQGKLLAMSFFAFNPLVVIESLVSAHNDILMLFFALVFLYLLVSRKKIWALFFLFLSAGIKFVTASFLPLYFLVIFNKKVNWQMLIKTMMILFFLFLTPVIMQREPYPWYFVSIIGLASLVAADKFVSIIIIGLTLGLLMRYTPFLYFGDYKASVPILTFWLTVIPLVFSIIIWLLLRLGFMKIKRRRET